MFSTRTRLLRRTHFPSPHAREGRVKNSPAEWSPVEGGILSGVLVAIIQKSVYFTGSLDLVFFTRKSGLVFF